MRELFKKVRLQIGDGDHAFSNRILRDRTFRRRHHPRRMRGSGGLHLNYILGSRPQRFVRKLLCIVVGDWSRIHCRCAHVPTEFWFQSGLKRNLPDWRLGNPGRRRARPTQRWIRHRHSRFAARCFGIFRTSCRCRLRLWTGQRNNRRSFLSCLERPRLELLVLRLG